MDISNNTGSVLNKMADFSNARKPRKSNFSLDEVGVLVDSVRTHYNVLYGKFAKRATNRGPRQRAWLDILKKVNGVSVEKRTLQEVKNKWKKCQYAMKEKANYHADDDADSSWEEFDSMPLQERLSKSTPPEKPSSNQGLKSQPLSPTKLKVTRQGVKAPTKPVEPPPSPANEEMCLRWNSHHSNMQTAFPNILHKEQYVDVTLAAEGKTLKCHRLILSSCSPYFEEILSNISPFQHPVLFMRDIPFWILKSLCDFMYAGEVHIYQNKLEELLTVAEALKIKGLAGKSTPPDNTNTNQDNKDVKKKPQPPQQQQQQQEKAPSTQKRNPYSSVPNFETTSQDYENEELLDPLDLLEPLYEEVAEEKKPSTIVRPKETKYQYAAATIKKTFPKKLRKRKYSEHRELSPPPVFTFRKGTRSRPNVKIPKYYHSDYNVPKSGNSSQNDPLMDVDEIKTEPIDVEDNNLVDYNTDEDNNQFFQNPLPTNLPLINNSMIITSTTRPLQTDNKFKKIKLTKPVISEVHSIEEAGTTPGGLEVIKITLAQPDPAMATETVVNSDAAVEIEPPPPITTNEAETIIQPVEVPPESNQLDSAEAAESSEDSSEEEEEEEEEVEEAAPELSEAAEEGAVTDVEVANNNQAEADEPPLLNDVRCVEEVEQPNVEEEERLSASLDHLEKEAMSVADAINLESQVQAMAD